MLPVVKEPGDITVVVAGGDLAIPQLAYFPVVGLPTLPAHPRDRDFRSSDRIATH